MTTSSPIVADIIARRYLEASGGDAQEALLEVIRDALADLVEAERRTLQRDRLVSRRYERAAQQEVAGS